MGCDVVEVTRPWRGALVAAVLAAVAIAAGARRPRTEGWDRRDAELMRRVQELQDQCSDHGCCRTQMLLGGGCSTSCRTPRRQWLPGEADSWEEHLQDQAMEILDTLPDGAARCEFLAAMPHDARLDQLCPTWPVVVKQPTEPLSREELMERSREKDDQLSAVLEGSRMP